MWLSGRDSNTSQRLSRLNLADIASAIALADIHRATISGHLHDMLFGDDLELPLRSLLVSRSASVPGLEQIEVSTYFDNHPVDYDLGEESEDDG